jgi:small subunit ribosomal protein S6
MLYPALPGCCTKSADLNTVLHRPFIIRPRVPGAFFSSSGTNDLDNNIKCSYRNIFNQKKPKTFMAKPLRLIHIPLPLQPNNFFNLKTGFMNNYELMVIFTPVLSEEDYKAAQKKYASLVKENGGEVVHENAWGLKSLAYPIAKKTTGLYLVMEYNAPSTFNEKLKIQLLRDESVLRHMFTALDKYAVEYNTRKRSGVRSGTDKAVEA